MAELCQITTSKRSPPYIWYYVSVEEEIVVVKNAAMHVTVTPAPVLDAKTEENTIRQKFFNISGLL